MSQEQRRRFLLELQYSGNVNFACHAAGIDRRTAYATRKDDEVFEQLWRRAVENARAYLEQRMGMGA